MQHSPQVLEDRVWIELNRRIEQILDGEAFRCIELLSMKEQSRVAQLVRLLLKEQLERARAAKVQAASVVLSWDRVIGPLDAGLVNLAQNAQASAGGSACSCHAATSVKLQDAPKDTRSKKRRLEGVVSNDDEDFLRYAEIGDDARALALLDRKPELLKCANDSGLTALHLAAVNGYHLLACRLLERRADVNGTTSYGFGPLMLAVQSENNAVVATLLERQASVNCKASFDGRTCLHLCAAAGHVDLCRRLLDAVADPMLKDRKGKTALEKARECGQQEVLEMLEITSDLGS